MFRPHARLFAAAFSVLLFTASFFGQGTTGQIAGTVTDPNGAVVPGAAVKATNIATNLTRETTTNDDGIYGFQVLPPGRYKVEVTASGFAPITVEADVVAFARVSGNDTVLVATPRLWTRMGCDGPPLGAEIRPLHVESPHLAPPLIDQTDVVVGA